MQFFKIIEKDSLTKPKRSPRIISLLLKVHSLSRDELTATITVFSFLVHGASGFTNVVLIEPLVIDLCEHTALENTKQIPGGVE